MGWLQEHATLLSAAASFLTAFVWIFYAQFAIMTYLHQRRPRVIVDQTEEQTLDSKFLIVNLSELPVYINHIIVAVRYDDQERVRRLRTYHYVSSEEVHEEPAKAQQRLRGGLLNPGDHFLLGDTDVLLAWMMEEDETDQETPHAEKLRQAISQLDTIDIRVIVTVGVSDRPVGSSRRFEVAKTDTDILIRPVYAQTRHLTSWRERKIVEEWRRQLLEEESRSMAT